MTYAEKLKDPRWQKIRLEILDRDGWTCQGCGEKENSLHVHHCLYQKGKEPWDYSESDLVTLCDECHEIVHWYLKLRDDQLEILRVINATENYLKILKDTLRYDVGKIRKLIRYTY